MIQSEEYRIKKLKRLNIRYYRIELNEKIYIIDYSNPKDIRNYFPGLFRDSSTRWKIFDDFGDIDDVFELKKPKKTKNIRLGIVLFLLYLINIILFPNKYNLSKLTYNPKILENWLLVLVMVFLGSLVIYLFLNIFNRQSNYKNSDDYYWLEKVEKEAIKMRSNTIINSLKWLISYIILIGSFALVGLISSSYSQLFVFFIIPTYLLLFGKFIKFNEIESQKYRIIEKEN